MLYERREYSAGAVKHSFWFMEFRKVVQLVSEGKTLEEIRKLNREENIFGAPTVMQNWLQEHGMEYTVKALTGVR